MHCQIGLKLIEGKALGAETASETKPRTNSVASRPIELETFTIRMTSFVTALRTSLAVILRAGRTVAISILNNALLETAKSHFDASLKLRLHGDDRRSLAATYHSLGNVSLWSGALEAAVERYQLALELRREMGDRSAVVSTLGALGQLSINLSETEDALRYFREVLPLFYKLKHPTMVTLTVVQFMQIAFKAGEKERATVLFGAADRLRAEFHSLVPPREREGVEAQLRELRMAQSEDEFQKTLCARESDESVRGGSGDFEFRDVKVLFGIEQETPEIKRNLVILI